MAPGPTLSPVQSIARGTQKLLDGNPSNNVDGLRDIASGAVQATSAALSALDSHLQKHGMSLSQITFPAIGKTMRDQYTNPHRIVAQSVAAGIRQGLKDDPDAEAKQKAEAEKKSREEEQKAKQLAETRKEEAARLERQRFMHGRKDNKFAESALDEKQQQVQNRPKVSLV